jgi:type I restriction enzyme S subunit
MSEDLPNGWLELTLGQTGLWSSGGTPSRQHQEYFANGAIPWVKSGDLPDGSILKTDECITDLGLQNSSAKLMPSGTISMALYGATIGKLGVMSFPAATNQACVNVIPDTRLVEPQYLFWYLFSERTAFIEKGKGGAQPNISQEIVRAHPFNLAPLAEQRRIVAKLGGIFAKLSTSTHSLSKISKTLPRFRRSILVAAFSGRLTADWRADAIDDEEFPSTWEKRRLD